MPETHEFIQPTPVVGDGETVPKNEDEKMNESDYGMYKQNLYTQMDRHNRNAVTFDNVLQFGFAGSNEFRTANAARVVLESGSGRTRAETNLPASTSAAGNAGG